MDGSRLLTQGMDVTVVVHRLNNDGTPCRYDNAVKHFRNAAGAKLFIANMRRNSHKILRFAIDGEEV